MSLRIRVTGSTGEPPLMPYQRAGTRAVHGGKVRAPALLIVKDGSDDVSPSNDKSSISSLH